MRGRECDRHKGVQDLARDEDWELESEIERFRECQSEIEKVKDFVT